MARLRWILLIPILAIGAVTLTGCEFEEHDHGYHHDNDYRWDRDQDHRGDHDWSRDRNYQERHEEWHERHDPVTN